MWSRSIGIGGIIGGFGKGLAREYCRTWSRITSFPQLGAESLFVGFDRRRGDEMGVTALPPARSHRQIVRLAARRRAEV
jgi:hypothetical protein